MANKIMALHVQDAFSSEKQAQAVFDVVAEQRPDVAIFAEAWREDRGHLIDDVVDTFHSRGYAVVPTLYEDDDDREDRHGMIGIVRNRFLTDKLPGVVRLGSRNAVHLPYSYEETGETCDVYGIHLDDRYESRRLGQAAMLLEDVIDDSRPTVVAGKYNAMYRDSRMAQALRMASPFVQRLPAADPRPDVRPSTLRRFASLSIRSSAMAIGATMGKFEGADFQDADPTHQPTKGPFNIDRITYRGLVAAMHIDKRKILFKDQCWISATF